LIGLAGIGTGHRFVVSEMVKRLLSSMTGLFQEGKEYPLAD